MAGRKTIQIVVTGKARPEITVEDMIRVVLALGRELERRSSEEGTKSARMETAG